MKRFMVVGVDVSKSTLDFFFKPTEVAMKTSNSQKGFKQWFRELQKCGGELENVLVIMEHTGQYSNRFESFLRSRLIEYCKIPALQIKRSLGVIRGKNDQIDAARIADYGWLRRDILAADEYPVKAIAELRKLLSLRAKMVKDRSGYMSRLKEMKATGTCIKSDCLGKMQQQLIDFFSVKIKLIEAKIKELIASENTLQKTSELLRSIKGVGFVLSSYMIGCTENFRRFRNARKFNCYAGIAPFKNESGSSIKGKSKISHLANKTAKSLLDRAASTAIQHDQELKAYYQRRRSEGKTKRCCLNIARAKIVARMFAVIKRQTPFQEFIQAA
jgi:transposase